MRNLLALIGALVVLVGGLGWYLGWYKVHVTKAPDGNVRIEADVDVKKAGNDTGELLKKGGQAVGEAVDKANEGKSAQPGPPGTTPGPVPPPQTGTQRPADEGGWLFGPATPKQPMGK
jgi:hypothetical protein